MTVCCSSAGGTMRLTVDGTVYPVRGSVTIQPTRYEISEGANLDSSLFTTFKPVPAVIELTLSDYCGLSIKRVQGLQCIDATVELDSTGKTYILVNASVTGRPQLNPETGEISSLKLVATSVREIDDDSSLNFIN